MKYYNPNPKGNKVGDCVVRAISKVLNQSWSETYIGLCIQGFLMGDMPTSNAVWGNYLENRGFEREIIPISCKTVFDFAEFLQNGTAVVGTGSHAIAVVNGEIYDTWDSSDEEPIYYYRKEV